MYFEDHQRHINDVQPRLELNTRLLVPPALQSSTTNKGKISLMHLSRRCMNKDKCAKSFSAHDLFIPSTGSDITASEKADTNSPTQESPQNLVCLAELSRSHLSDPSLPALGVPVRARAGLLAPPASPRRTFGQTPRSTRTVSSYQRPTTA